MRYLLILISFFLFSFVYSQSNEQTNSVLFAQCMFTIDTQEEIDELQRELYLNHTNIEMVRLDIHTQRSLFIIHTNSLTEEEFKSWFGEYESTVRCVQIGVYGVDVMNQYPFPNCN